MVEGSRRKSDERAIKLQRAFARLSEMRRSFLPLAIFKLFSQINNFHGWKGKRKIEKKVDKRKRKTKKTRRKGEGMKLLKNCEIRISTRIISNFIIVSAETF